MIREKRAILVVSYGCSYAEAREKTLNRIEKEIQEAYPGCPVCTAWTSRMIRRRLWEQKGIWIPDVREAAEELRAQGVREIAVQPTHVLHGLENQSITEELQDLRESFSQIVIGAPLLSSDEDKKKVIRIIGKEIRPAAEEALVLVGHGTGGSANAVYREIDEGFLQEGYANIFVGTMEGQSDFFEVLRQIRSRNPQRILLAPFMITAGKHAAGELSGEKASSWKSRLEAAGFSVECIFRGLGEYEGIRRIFAEHVEDSMKILEKAYQ